MMIDIRDHGANPAGPAQNISANTAAVQAALDIARTRGEGEEVYIPHNTSFDPASLDYGPEGYPTRLAISGKVFVASPLHVRDYFSLRGLGGASGAQFLISPYSALLSDGSLAPEEPLIRVTGPADHRLVGLWLLRTDGLAAVFDRAAEVVVERCRFDVWAPGDSPAVIIRDSFWLWYLHCAFGNQANGTTNTEPSVLIENDPSYPWDSGLLYFRDPRFNGGGIALRNQTETGQWHGYGTLHIDDGVFEVPRSPFLTVGENCRLSSAIFTASGLADGNWHGDALDSPFVQNNGQIGQLISRGAGGWSDSSAFLAGNAPNFVEFDQAGRPATVVANAPLAARRERIDGAFDVTLANRGLTDIVLSSPGEPMPISKEWADWGRDSPLLEVSGGERDPRGQNGAARVRLVDEGAPPFMSLRFYHDVGSPPWVDGEWIILGFWVRNLSQEPMKNELLIVCHGDAGWTVDGQFYMAQPWLDSLASREWRPVVRAIRMQRASPDAWDNPLLTFFLQVHKGTEMHVWRPFGLRLPADMPEYDVARIGATITRHASDIAVGHAGLEEDVTFKAGRGAVRPDAVAVGDGAQYFDTVLGRPIWSSGGVWVTACGAIAP